MDPRAGHTFQNDQRTIYTPLTRTLLHNAWVNGPQQSDLAMSTMRLNCYIGCNSGNPGHLDRDSTQAWLAQQASVKVMGLVWGAAGGC